MHQCTTRRGTGPSAGAKRRDDKTFCCKSLRNSGCQKEKRTARRPEKQQTLPNFQRPVPYNRAKSKTYQTLCERDKEKPKQKRQIDNKALPSSPASDTAIFMRGNWGNS